MARMNLRKVYLLGLREKVEHICYRGYTEVKGWRGRETVEKRDEEGANLGNVLKNAHDSMERDLSNNN
ncbi:hypothetical protein MTR_8g005865 [Medicago truncatula]|uniref:Uncharacterized protein n=1 Tax=Medicago truncatula TaxID=3880 RepID=A0A072TKR0_MEDTR|nr:hypothetical protein MTR_8g005865 [Medicago truncatula]